MLSEPSPVILSGSRRVVLQGYFLYKVEIGVLQAQIGSMNPLNLYLGSGR